MKLNDALKLTLDEMPNKFSGILFNRKMRKYAFDTSKKSIKTKCAEFRKKHCTVSESGRMFTKK